MKGSVVQKAARPGQIVDSALLRELRVVCSPGEIALNVDLSKMSRWRIGGTADCLIRPANTEQLAATVKLFASLSVPYVVIGATTNLLFSDEGLRVPCIQLGPNLSEVQVEGDTVVVGAGCWVPRLAWRVMKAGLTGAEHICGIPGTLGGLICMNGGSQRKGIGESVVEVVSVERSGGYIRRTADECAFTYRSSIFQHNDEIIAEATLKFRSTPDRQAVRRLMLALLSERRRKFPRKLPNCGSVFVSDPTAYARSGPPGAIIESAGFKGYGVGGAEVSRLHANFIVNKGGATARDVTHLITEIRETVWEREGVEIRCEVRYVDPHGRIAPLHEFGNI